MALRLVAAGLACLAMTITTAAASPGLRLNVWENNARTGTPTTSVIPTPKFTISGDKAFSADIEVGVSTKA